MCLCIFILNTSVQGCTSTAAGWGNIFLRLNVGFLPQIAVSPSTLGTPPLVRRHHHHLHHHHRHWHHHQYHLFLSMVLQQKASEPAAFIRDPANQSPELISYSITPSFLSILQESSYSIDHTTTCPSFLKYALFLHDAIKINISYLHIHISFDKYLISSSNVLLKSLSCKRNNAAWWTCMLPVKGLNRPQI